MATPGNELRLFFKNAVDSATSALGVIDNDHKAIHEGLAYSTFISTTTVADGASIAMTIHVPTSTSGKYFHLKHAEMGMGNSPASFRFIENGSHTLTTASMNAYAKNRIRNTATTAVIYGNTIATYTAAAAETILSRADEYAASAQQVSSKVETREHDEWVLRSGYPYIFVATNNSGTATSAHISAFWYEESGY